MKALVLREYGRLVYEDVPEPVVAPDEVLVKVEACGICGSDVHGLDGSTGRRQPPLIMGHEAAGVIASVGPAVKGWSTGDRVTFDSTLYRLDDWYTRRGHYNLSDGRVVLGVSPGEYRRHGAFAELVAVPQHVLYRLPDGMSFERAAMAEPVAVSVHAVGLTPVAVGDTAVVIGAGMIGLCLIQVLRAAGCSRVLAVDVEPARRELACRLGAADAFDPQQVDVARRVAEATDGPRGGRGVRGGRHPVDRVAGDRLRAPRRDGDARRQPRAVRRGAAAGRRDAPAATAGQRVQSRASTRWRST